MSKKWEWDVMEIRKTLPYPDDPQLLRIGREFAADAYAMAHDLEAYGADAMAWLMTNEQLFRERACSSVEIPAELADALMVLLLWLPRSGKPRGRRPLWSRDRAQKLLDNGMKKRQIAKMFSKETGLPAENIRTRLRGLKKSRGG